MRRLPILVGFAVITAANIAFSPGTDHVLLNASSGRISLDIRSSRDKPITHFQLAPGYSVGFNGVFIYLRVQLPNGKVLKFSEQQLIELHGGSTPAKGQWLVEDSGLRYPSHRDYMLAYRRFHKLWP